MTMQFRSDAEIMQYALTLAKAGEGFVEPNPMVGAVIVNSDRELIADGIHARFGEAHAEVQAIRNASGRTQGADLFVTLEPCCHHGKTPPCVDLVLAAGFRRVVVGCADPAPHTAGKGLKQLRAGGLIVESGVCEAAARRLIAPFEKLMCRQQPWVHAKWAMTLDGRIASRTGHSRWISGEPSRTWVHALRGRMDAIVTGAGTVRADDPLLTARPPGSRIPRRVVFDSGGTSLASDCQLLRTSGDAPVLVCVSDQCTQETERRLRQSGAEVFRTGAGSEVDVITVLNELGRRNCTNILIEAGSRLLGAFFAAGAVDEIHAFVCPKIVGGADAPGPVGGPGLRRIPQGSSLSDYRMTQLGDDLLIQGDYVRSADPGENE